MALGGESTRRSELISLVRPRLDEKPWGGNALRKYGMEIPDDLTIGEALVTANDAGVSDGFGVGRTLGEIISDDPARRLGERGLKMVGGRSLFPLLVKLIDANQDLSIQVHPDDEQAASLDRLGKTEAWHVLDARPGSFLYLGLNDPDDLDSFATAADRLDGSSASHLRAIEAHAGSTYLLPAGTVHALGAGVIVYEIQQPSDVTYRLDDWGRVNAAGRPREMHREAGLAVLRPELQPYAIASVPIDGSYQVRSILVACEYFALERWEWTNESEGIMPESVGPQVLTVLEGEVAVGGFSLKSGESAVMWPGGDEVSIEGAKAVMLRGWIPDASDALDIGIAR